MNAQVLRGSKQEIGKTITQMHGDVREAIVFIEEPGDTTPRADEDIFVDMQPFMVSVGGADYSRESLYGRAAGE
jgi:hypothetical protein